MRGDEEKIDIAVTGSAWDRRRFLKVLGTAAASAGVSARGFGEAATEVGVVVDDVSAMAARGPGVWAVERLKQALQAREIVVTRAARLADVGEESLSIVAAGVGSSWAMETLQDLRIAIPATAEAF